MKSTLLSFCLFILPFSFLLPQSIELQQERTTRAVVIGISDYQDEDIPDLQFADRDAEAFVAYLQSPTGGNLPDENIRLLTNEIATAGKMGAELGWLIDESKEGDVAIIYFSGHGDVEANIFGDPGYLLTWDSPSRSYGTGAFSLDYFKRIVKTLSIQNKVKVIVITDACRAGALAGEKYGGAQLSNQNLAIQYANEIKILSCQPDEFSIEGDQWGGGIFSHHLIEGLYGFADENADEQVILKEIERYLEDKVSQEAEPHQQTPMVVGNIKEIISNVDKDLLTKLRNSKNPMIQPFSGIDQKGYVEDLLATLDTNIVELYHSFLAAVDNKQFFEPTATCADTLYKRLIECEELMPLHNQLRRNYAAALQDDAQQMINRLVFKPEKEIGLWYSPKLMLQTYGPYPKMLDRAADLLGPGHYMYSVLKARKAFFEGGLIYLNRIELKDKINGEKAINKFRESLKWQPRAPHTYLWMAMTFYFNLSQLDSAEFYIQKAEEISPSWQLPFHMQLNFYLDSRQIKKSGKLLRSLGEIDSTNILILNRWSDYYFSKGDYKKSGEFIDLIMAVDSTAMFFYSWKILTYGLLGQKEEALRVFNKVIQTDSLDGLTYYSLGNMYYVLGEYENSVPHFQKALEVDSSLILSYSSLGDALIILERFDEAESVLKIGFSKDSTFMPLVNALGGVYAGKEELKKAAFYYSKAIELNDSNMLPYYNLAMVQAKQKKLDSALENLEKFLQKGGTILYDHIQTNTDLENLRGLPQFEEIMKKYFPEKFKD